MHFPKVLSGQVCNVQGFIDVEMIHPQVLLQRRLSPAMTKNSQTRCWMINLKCISVKQMLSEIKHLNF